MSTVPVPVEVPSKAPMQAPSPNPTPSVSGLPGDTATLIADLKSGVASLSTAGQNAFKQFLNDAHKEAVDVQAAGGTIWSMISNAVHGSGTIPVTPVTPAPSPAPIPVPVPASTVKP